jgi:hypothetical protein
MLLDFIVYGVFIFFFIMSVSANIIIFIKNKKMQAISISLALEKFTIAKKLEEVLAENESKKLEKDDGFIKFLSQSRETAFNYIEEVQEAIVHYAKDKSDNNYNKLISFLPKEDEKR